MPWVRFDDQYPIHRKVSVLTDAAFRLDVEAKCWSSRNLTDGRVAADELEAVRAKATRAHAAELVRRGLWHDAGHQCPSAQCAPPGPDGWVIHDFLDYNPSRSQAVAEREAKSKRQQRWREAKVGRRNGDASTSRDVDAGVDASRDAYVDGVVDARVDASRDGPVDAYVDGRVDPAPRAHVSRPDPPRPEGKRGGDLPEAPAAGRAAAGPAGDGRNEDQTLGGHPPSNGWPADPWPDEAPDVLAAEADDIRRTAEAIVADAHHQQKRTAQGAAAARAAIAKPATRAGRHSGGFEALRAATPDVPPLADPSTPVTPEPNAEPEDPTDDQENPHAVPAA